MSIENCIFQEFLLPHYKLRYSATIKPTAQTGSSERLAFISISFRMKLCFLQGFLLEAVAVVLRDFRAVARQDDDGRRRFFDDGGAVDDVAVDEAVA